MVFGFTSGWEMNTHTLIIDCRANIYTYGDGKGCPISSDPIFFKMACYSTYDGVEWYNFDMIYLIIRDTFDAI